MTKPEKLSCTDPKEIHAQSRKSGLTKHKPGKDHVARLAECSWVENDEVLAAISETGCGRSFVAQAFGNAACRRLLPARYVRLADLCAELNRACMSKDGTYFQRMDRFKSVKLLIVDDFLTTPIETASSVDLFEIPEAREGRRATMIASQLEPNGWYLRIEGELIIADSILGRVASACRYLDIDGPDMRKWIADNRPKRE